jgi:hypothetical protein
VYKMVGLAIFVAATSVLASPASAVCLRVDRSNGSAFWVNSCSVHVNVSWSDNRFCQHWTSRQIDGNDWFQC